MDGDEVAADAGPGGDVRGPATESARWSADGRDPVDWAYLYACHADALRRLIARRLPRGGPVDDVLQETFARAIRSTPLIDTTKPVWPFLATVAGRAVADWWTRDGGVRSVAHAVATAGGDYPGSDEHASSLDRVIGARRALGALSARHRRVLFLYEGADTPFEDLVALDRTNPKALKSALARARQRFRARYHDVSIERSPADGPCRDDRLRQAPA